MTREDVWLRTHSGAVRFSEVAGFDLDEYPSGDGWRFRFLLVLRGQATRMILRVPFDSREQADAWLEAFLEEQIEHDEPLLDPGYVPPGGGSHRDRKWHETGALG